MKFQSKNSEKTWKTDLWFSVNVKMNRICLINLFIDLSLTSTSTSQMLPFLLLVAAALPVLGEAQIKKQQNAGKKRGNKIRDQNPLPSCTNHSTSSTSYERSPLFLEIPQNAQLFGHPGTRHRFKKKNEMRILFLNIVKGSQCW